MRRDHHVGGLAVERQIDDAGIVLLQAVGIEAPVAGLFQLGLRAQIGPGGVVELQVAAAGIVEAADRLPIGLAEILEDGVAIGILLGLDGIRLEPEMQRSRARDAHFRRDAGVCFQELEMLQHRVIGEAELAFDARGARPGLHALKLDAVIELLDLDAVEHAVEVEMPPGAAEFAVGRDLEPDLLLLLDDGLDLAILDGGELRRADLALLALGARFLQRRGAQDRADHVGAERRLASRHRAVPPQNSLAGTKRGPRVSSTKNVVDAAQRGRHPNMASCPRSSPAASPTPHTSIVTLPSTTSVG